MEHFHKYLGTLISIQKPHENCNLSRVEVLKEVKAKRAFLARYITDNQLFKSGGRLAPAGGIVCGQSQSTSKSLLQNSVTEFAAAFSATTFSLPTSIALRKKPMASTGHLSKVPKTTRRYTRLKLQQKWHLSTASKNWLWQGMPIYGFAATKNREISSDSDTRPMRVKSPICHGSSSTRHISRMK